MIPFFCQGKDVQTATSGAVGVGTRTIPVQDASSYFASGLRLFISHADGSEVEYLGHVQSVDVDSVTVELATTVARAAGASVWTPLYALEWPAGRDVAVTRRRRTGVELVRTLGAEAYASRLHDAYEEISVRLSNLTDSRLDALLSWLEQQAEGALQDFTCVDADRTVWRVMFDLAALEWTRTERDLTLAEFNLQLLEKAVYV